MPPQQRKLARVAAGLTQEQAAARAGMSQSRYSAIERGAVMPDEQTRHRIAQTLGRRPEELFPAHSPECQSA